jgi:hypothetical protein
MFILANARLASKTLDYCTSVQYNERSQEDAVDRPATVSAGDLLDELRRKRLLTPASQIDGETVLVSSGHVKLDRVCGGGLPKGCIVEIVAPSCGGGTILYSFLAATTARGELCALLDPADGFDVSSAHAAGVGLDRLLWVRARGRKEALQAAELILDAGGFQAVVLDLLSRKSRTAIPPAAWMRLRRLASISQAVVLVLSQTAETGTFATLSVQVQRGRARFRGAKERWLEGIDLSFELRRKKYG